MSMSRFRLAFVTTLCALPAAAAAQTVADAAAPAPPRQPDADAEEGEEIVVSGQKPPGSVIGDIAPETTLTPGDIRSYGVSSLSELLTELAPQTGSVQGRGGEGPVVLLGGRRISSFAEIRDIPTEAIQRVEILPEEVALKYGYRPDQKVVNVVLRRRFRAMTLEAQGGAATEGGRTTQQGDAALLRIREGTRTNLALRYSRATPLYESERRLTGEAAGLPYDAVGNLSSTIAGGEVDPGLGALLGRAATVVGVPDAAAAGPLPIAGFALAQRATDTTPFRTLLAGNDTVSLNGVLARTIFGDVGASLNASLGYSDTDSAQGLARTRLTLPAAGPFSPFAGDTFLYRYLDEFDPLAQQVRNWTGHLGSTFTGAVAKWNWTLTGTYDRATTRTATETGYDLAALQSRIAARDPTINPFAPLADGSYPLLADRARGTSSVGEVQMIVTGSPFRLPAGPATATVRIGGTLDDFDSRALRGGVASAADLSRDTGSGQLSLDLPVASRRRGVLAWLGDLSLNLNVGVERVSGFGALQTAGIGATWRPDPKVSLIASYNRDEGAPTIQQLGNPTVLTSGVRVFDFVRGESAEIMRQTGGNAALAADDRRVFKLGLTVRPAIERGDLSLTGTFTRSRIDDPIAAFPTATAAIEAAFPDRFSRDAAGRLLRIDSRPINYAASRRDDFRWGFNFSKQLSAPTPSPGEGGRGGGRRPPGEGEPSLRDMLPRGDNAAPTEGQAAPDATARETDRQADGGERRGSGGPGGGPGGFGGRGGGGFGGGGGGGRGTRLQLAAFHTWHLKDTLLVAPGGPLLDLLDGDAIASSGGQPRHEVDVQAGLTRNGLGMRLSGRWQSATEVAGGVGGGQLLRFSDLTTLNLRLFANVGQIAALTRAHPFFRGTRVSLNVSNLFNDRLRVTDTSGATPVNYQPGYLDPLGRSVSLSIRKLFF